MPEKKRADRDKKDVRKDKATTCRVCGMPLANSKEAEGAFCSARCRLQDLSKWFGESYRIASNPAERIDDGESGEE